MNRHLNPEAQSSTARTANARSLVRRGAIVTAGTMFLLAPVSAFAADTDPDVTVDDTFASLTTKVTHYGSLLVALAVIGILVGVGIKYLRKARQAS